jgi:asparagine synthase (glutamine-hydrolysing)
MCGIVGFLTLNDLDYKNILTAMVSKINHRGPDSDGIWYNEKYKIGLGHARLAIVDLSITGHQPMSSISGRYTMVFNGEIYNHKSIRKKIEAITKIQWKGTSDTETIVTAIEFWGLNTTIENCVGMFSIALWDALEEKITLVRDRMGEKPLYYGWVNGNFVFASELKPIQSFPLFANQINRNALKLFLKHSSIPDPYSIYEDIYKLEPGTILSLNVKTKAISKEQYWSIEKIANANNNPKFIGSSQEAVVGLENLLKDSINLQAQADVPLGAFLSGGVDSSVIVALMQAQSDIKVNTFSIGFDQKEYNEANHAKKVANHIGTNHHETYITGKEVLDIVPLLPKIYTEPFSEASQIPTYLVAKIAKKAVTVSLSGDAGDELFCGYTRYQLANKSWNRSSQIPSILRNIISKSISNLPQGLLEVLLKPFDGKTDINGLKINPVDRLLKIAPLLNCISRKELYSKGFMTHNLDTADWILNAGEAKSLFDTNKLALDSFFAEMMSVDLLTYLPNNNLVKVDRASMANSLETRVPLLDHRIVEFAMSLPLEYKLRNGVDKWVLRQVLYKYVPKSLIERPKMGFGVPLAEWMRGPLREWCENLINKRRLDDEGFFDSDIIQTKWKEHLNLKRNWQAQLWDVMVFQAWLEDQKNS